MLKLLLLICPPLACAVNGVKTNNVTTTNGSTSTRHADPLTSEKSSFGDHLSIMEKMPIFDRRRRSWSHSWLAINYLEKTSRLVSECPLSDDEHLALLKKPNKLAEHDLKYVHEECSGLYDPRPWEPELRAESLFFVVDPEHPNGGIVFKVVIERRPKQTTPNAISKSIKSTKPERLLPNSIRDQVPAMSQYLATDKTKPTKAMKHVPSSSNLTTQNGKFSNSVKSKDTPKIKANSEPEKPKRIFGEKEETYEFVYVRREHLQKYICIDAKLSANVYVANTSPVNGERCFERSFVFDYEEPEVQSLWGAEYADQETFEFYRKKLNDLPIVRTSAYEAGAAWVHERSWMDDAGLKASLFFTINADNGGYLKWFQFHDIGPTEFKYTNEHSRYGPWDWQSKYQRKFLDADEFKKDENKYICVLRKIHGRTFEVVLRKIAEDGCFLARRFVHNAPVYDENSPPTYWTFVNGL